MAAPDPREELERKAIDALQNAAGLYGAGRIDGGAFKAAAQAIYSTVSGLIEWSSLGIVEEALKEELEPTLRRRIFMKETALVIITHQIGTDEFTMATWLKGKSLASQTSGYGENPNPYLAITHAMDSLAVKLGSQGFVEL